MNHKGNWLGTFLRWILDEQRKFYSSGIWTCDLRIDVPVLYQLPILSISLSEVTNIIYTEQKYKRPM